MMELLKDIKEKIDEAKAKNNMEFVFRKFEEIFNSKIRYKLEGYMFPSTYEFYNDSSLDEIIDKYKTI